MSAALNRLVEALGGLLTWIAGLLFLSVFLVNVVNITLRYVLGVSYVWLPDLSRILFIWMVFLGGAAAYIRGQHLVIEFLRQRMQGRLARANDLLVNLMLAGFFAFLLHAGLRIARLRMRIPYDSWQAVPTAVSYAALPVAAALMLVATLVRLLPAPERDRPPAP